MSCKIVCPNACRNCGITPCADRMADEDKEEVTAASTELSAFYAGSPSKGSGLRPYEDGAFSRTSGSKVADPYEDKIIDIKEAEGLKHCGMRSDISCRHCHDDTCKIRKADRRF